MWLQTLRDVVGTLKAEGRAARWHALSCVKQLLTSAPPFLELPHIGSRNLRQRQLDKLFFTVRRYDEAEEEMLLYMMRLPEGAVAWELGELRARSWSSGSWICRAWRGLGGSDFNEAMNPGGSAKEPPTRGISTL